MLLSRILPRLWLAAGLALTWAAAEVGAAPLASLPPPAEARVVDSFGHLPLVFIENRGQVDERVPYYLQGRDQNVFFTSQGLVFVLHGRWALRVEDGPAGRGGNGLPAGAPGESGKARVRLRAGRL